MEMGPFSYREIVQVLAYVYAGDTERMPPSSMLLSPEWPPRPCTDQIGTLRPHQRFEHSVHFAIINAHQLSRPPQLLGFFRATVPLERDGARRVDAANTGSHDQNIIIFANLQLRNSMSRSSHNRSSRP